MVPYRSAIIRQGMALGSLRALSYGTTHKRPTDNLKGLTNIRFATTNKTVFVGFIFTGILRKDFARKGRLSCQSEPDCGSERWVLPGRCCWKPDLGLPMAAPGK